MAGADMPVTRLMIDLACRVRRVDYWKDGLNLEKMGLASVPVDRLAQFLEEGHL